VLRATKTHITFSERLSISTATTGQYSRQFFCLIKLLLLLLLLLLHDLYSANFEDRVGLEHLFTSSSSSHHRFLMIHENNQNTKREKKKKNSTWHPSANE